jgi:predicted extracellular nuclease
MSLRRPVGLLALSATAASSLALLTATPAAAASPDVVIAEAYGGGGNSGATLKRDFVELLNPTTAPVSVAGWSIQYASAAGTSWTVTPLTGSIPAGGRYLVQQGAGAGGTEDLPTPDASGNVAMSATAFKLALTTSTVACTGTDCGLSAGNPALRDFLGAGSANASETAPAPAPSNTTSVARTGADTDNNANDFRAGAPTPQNTATAQPDPEPEPEPQPAITLISAVQGSGPDSPLAGQRVTVEAVVTGLRTTNDALSGFTLQEQDADRDSDPQTSEGLSSSAAHAAPPPWPPATCCAPPAPSGRAPR